MKNTLNPPSSRRGYLLCWIALLTLTGIWNTAKAQLPESFVVNVDKGGGQIVELNLHKHSVRSANFRVQSWDTVNGYVEEHTAQNPAMPVRTYRGYVTENPNELVTAIVDTSNELHATVHNGAGRIWTVANIDVTTEIGNGTSITPPPAPLATGSAPAGALLPPVGLYKAHGVYDVPSSQYKGSVDETLVYIEYQWNVHDFFNTRDAKLNMELSEVIIRKEQFYTPTSGNAGQFSSMLRSEWLAQGQNERGYICSFFPSGFTFAGGYASGNNFYNPGGEAVAVNALYHEVAHNWRAQHYYYGKDTMSGSHPAHGEMNTMRILTKRQQEIDEGDLQLTPSYATNMHPRAFLDLASTAVNTAVNIDPLANDWDANGDAISLKYYTANTVQGGTVTESGGMLTYTPAAAYVGKDVIVYEVQDTAGLYTQGLIHIEVINQGLAAHWAMEETSGTNAADGSGHGHDGYLVGVDFGANTIDGPVGKALQLDRGSYIVADATDLIAEPETYYPLENAASNFFDPMDQSFTATCWFKLDNSGDTAILMSKRNPGFFGYHLVASPSGLSATVRAWDGDIGWQTVSSGALVSDAWYHAAMVINRSDNTLRLYLNGQEVGTAASLPADLFIFNGREDLKLGGDAAVALDEAQVYTKALSLSEVQALHDAGEVPAAPVFPANDSLNIAVNGTVLSWLAGNSSYQHDVYFGTDAAAVANATTASPEYQGRQSATSFDPGTLDLSKNYFWRIDEVDGSTIIGGGVWKFSTAANSLASGMVLHLSMDDSDVQTANGTIHTYDDTALPAQDFQVINTPSTIAGVIGDAIDLSGADDALRSYIASPVKKPRSGGVSVSFWLNTSSTQNSGEKVYDIGGAYFMRYYNGDLQPVYDGSTGGAVVFDTNLNDGQWHHVAVINNGAGQTTLYIDGAQFGTQSESLYDVASLQRTVSIGAIYNGTSENIEAAYDDFAVWERELSGPEVSDIYTEGLLGNSVNAEPVLVDTSFEVADGFTGFPSGGTGSVGTVVDNDGVTWTEVTDVKIWNRTDIPPAGVQTLTLGLSSSNPICDVSIPGADHGIGTVSFDYAAFSSSTNTEFSVQYNAGSGWVEVWSTQMVGLDPNFSTKPWRTVELALNVPGDVALRFEALGSKGPMIDNLRITGVSVSNLAPVVNDQTFSVAENAVAGISAGTVAASDPDAGDALSYAITAGNAGGEFAINGSTGEITTTTVLDYETTNSYGFTVTVTDAGGLTDTALITVDVTNVNEAPTAVEASGSVAENSAVGTTVATVTSTDPDAGDSVTYVITAGNTGSAFTIDGNTGAVSTNAVLNYEVASNYQLAVTATDAGGLSDTVSVSVSVIDVNEAPTAANGSGSIAEDATVGSTVTTVSASDSDAGDTLSYSITGGNTGGAFLVNSSTGVITTAASLDHESNSSYTLTVSVTDAGGLSDTAAVNVTVSDVNEAPVASNGSGSINEDAAVGSTVLTVAASDPDAGDTLTYAITAGNAGGEFSINASTGEITTATELDFESTAGYSLTVSSTDAGGLSDSATIAVTVNDVNEDPVFANDPITGDNAILYAEYSGTLDGEATDPDTADTVTYSKVSGPAWLSVASDGTLSGTPGDGDEGLNSFEVEAADGNGGSAQATLEIMVATSGVVYSDDFEDYDIENPSDFSVGGVVTGNWVASNTASNATRTFSTTNFGGTRLWISNVDGTSITSNGIQVGNANYTMSVVMVTETATAGRQLNATYDILAGQTAATATSIIGGPQAVVTDGDSWSIDDSKTDHVYTESFSTAGLAQGDKLFLRFERVSVAANGGWFGVDDVKLELDGMNTAPVLGDASFSVDENGAGALVGTVTATDADAGDILSYAITAGNAGGEFAINGSTGEITTTTALDYETAGQYVLTVEVTDAGLLSDTASITVNVNDVNEAPVANDVSGSVSEDAAVGSAVVAVTSSDVDAGDSASYAITSGNVGGAFSIDSTTGEITTAAALDYEVTTSYLLTVSVTDGGGLTDTALVDITVIDVADVVSTYSSDAELVVSGLLFSGNYLDTVSSNNVYEVLQEEKTSGKPSTRVSSLEHTWSFDIGAAGALVELSVEAYHSSNNEGDDFVFGYSTDGIVFTDVITVTKTSDDNTAQVAMLPADISGTVYIRVKDTDRTVGNGSQDTISIDQLKLEVTR
ncbi:Cadherin domain-containing protein [Rubritalea squalenifaciens DSM 18772]|uniref:Cadherin domain-containing protein n=1 Tax=Rubritalea squalenifaciens DSM 18772 TaxID=1123071 RepID=A0A1M6M6S3_9BACT|nr:cadherin domain-containing protein [Rubritalea squalenifaciens]SHJ79148.1 Cadherin domain-containing protein [Rubritalea squalenifaciens DSM 18772]